MILKFDSVNSQSVAYHVVTCLIRALPETIIINGEQLFTICMLRAVGGLVIPKHSCVTEQVCFEYYIPPSL